MSYKNLFVNQFSSLFHFSKYIDSFDVKAISTELDLHPLQNAFTRGNENQIALLLFVLGAPHIIIYTL